MRIGALKNHVRVEKLAAGTTDPDYGGETQDWVPHKTAKANVVDVTTRQQEETKSDLRQLKHPCRVTMRYDDSITANMRIVVLDRGNRILNIVTQPTELGNRDGIEFMAEEYSA
jgi:SPP1 family predicted phage head-tail adaptor